MILLVEDDTLFRTTLKKVLVSSGFNVEEANNGEDGIIKCRKFKPELIITDFQLPKIDGLSMWKQIKDEHPKTAGILVSAHLNEEVEKDARSSGLSSVLSKPVDIELLEETIRNAF